MKFLTVKEVGEILNFRNRKILDLIHLGKLKAIKIDTRFRVSDIDLRGFIEKSRIESIWK
jgi:excisionase family DNA binding protein